VSLPVWLLALLKYSAVKASLVLEGAVIAIWCSWLLLPVGNVKASFPTFLIGPDTKLASLAPLAVALSFMITGWLALLIMLPLVNVRLLLIVRLLDSVRLLELLFIITL